MCPQYSKEVMDHFTNPRNVGEMENPDGIGQVGNPTCLVGGSMVQLNNHYQVIEDVEENERVLTHEGVFSNIVRRSVRQYDGPVLTFKNRLGSNTLTPDHLVYAIKRPPTQKYRSTRNMKTLRPDWYHAEELERGDIVLYPVMKEIRDQDMVELNITNGKFDHRSHDLPEKVPLDADFLRLAGFYLSEGNSVTKVTKAHVCFTFHEDEVDYQNDVIRIVKDLFGLKASIKTSSKQKSCHISVDSANLARFFEATFGTGAENKHIPDFIMFLPPEKQVHLIRALWQGDGYVNLARKGPRACFTTISTQLAGQVKNLLLRQGIIPSIYLDNGYESNGTVHKDSYRVHVGDVLSLRKLCNILGIDCSLIPQHQRSWIADGFLHTPLTGITTQHFNGTVYNFEVADQHSYTTDSLLVHNCGDLLWIYIKVENDVMTDVKFKTFGCGAAIATSSMVTELAKGKTLDEGLKITRRDIAEKLGGLPPQKMHCSNLAADALHEAIHDYLRKQGREPPLPPDAKRPHEEEACETHFQEPIQIEKEEPK
ncbi:MAG TPA: hypothetical protein GXZ80_01030 [Euryarchaeota archaeon]|jgi:nitrogen fixation NifU-like protein|nr:hypothetical protein [Euryarchaeota archaeon]